MITASELIEKLKQFNPNARIVVDAEDAGYNDINYVNDLQVTQSNYRSRYKGTLKLREKITDVCFDAVILRK